MLDPSSHFTCPRKLKAEFACCSCCVWFATDRRLFGGSGELSGDSWMHFSVRRRLTLFVLVASMILVDFAAARRFEMEICRLKKPEALRPRRCKPDGFSGSPMLMITTGRFEILKRARARESSRLKSCVSVAPKHLYGDA